MLAFAQRALFPNVGGFVGTGAQSRTRILTKMRKASVRESLILVTLD